MKKENRYESPLEVIVKGALSGLVGTVVLTTAMKGTPTVANGLRLAAPRLAGLLNRGKQEAEAPTEKLAGKGAEGVLETPIEGETKHVAGQAIHWGYGMAWGAFYGVMQSSLRLPHRLHGLLFGSLVGLVAATVVPATGLTRPSSEQPKSRNALKMSMHLIYGLATARAFHALSANG